MAQSKWIVGQDAYDVKGRMIYTEEGGVIVPVAFTRGPDADKHALLIAAAPDLLAACKRLIEGMAVHNRSGTGHCPCSVCEARAAIALAEPE